LADVVSKDDFVQDSEYLETLLVVVPRQVFATCASLRQKVMPIKRSLVKDWNAKYERLSQMVVPRTSQYVVISIVITLEIHIISISLITQDDEYALFSVVIFRRVHDDFVQKCRENKYFPPFPPFSFPELIPIL
jgi:V-type H+-transporting ATPase subunit C